MLDALERATSFHRWHRAKHHRLRKRSFKSRVEARVRPELLGADEPADGLPIELWRRTWERWSEWHEQRERGQAERFANVRRCGSLLGMVETYDPNTGEYLGERALEYHCNNWRVCTRCLRRRKGRLQREVLSVRRDGYRARWRQCCRSYQGQEGRWEERLLTLTCPHTGVPGSDVRILIQAWRKFSRKLADHLRIDRGCELSPVWLRALEVAPGQDGGHAHLHVWMISPFIDHVWARVTWGRILEELGLTCPHVAWDKAMTGWVDERGQRRGPRDQRVRQWCRTRRGVHGRETASVPWPHVDLTSPLRDRETGRKREPTEAAAVYASKVGIATYAVKGEKRTGELLRMNPLHAASVYGALEGTRAVQWARGWAPNRRSPYLHKLRKLTDAELAAWREQGASAFARRVSSVAARESCSASSADHTSRVQTTGPPRPACAPSVVQEMPSSGRQTTEQTMQQLSLL